MPAALPARSAAGAPSFSSAGRAESGIGGVRSGEADGEASGVTMLILGVCAAARDMKPDVSGPLLRV